MFKTMKIMKNITKFILDISIMTMVFTTLMVVVINESFGLKATAILPTTPINIGVKNINKYCVLDEETLNRQHDYERFIVPYNYLEKDDLAKKIYNGLDKRVQKEEEYLEELEKKKEMLNLMTVGVNVDRINELVDFLSFLPIELISKMYEDNLEFIFSGDNPTKVNDDQYRVAYYNRNTNKIVFSTFDNFEKTAIHEIGHWLESYIVKNIDAYYLKRISEEMKNELKNLQISDYLYEYAMSNPSETFAILFEVFIYDYEKFMFKAPIAYEYFSYYLTQILMENV